jgi:hypothetical protein
MAAASDWRRSINHEQRSETLRDDGWEVVEYHSAEDEMSVREIPPAFEYTCDLCGAIHLQENASGHYTDSRPPHWGRLTVAQDAHDWQGQAVADGTIKRLLCNKCLSRMCDAINAVKP